MKLLHQPLIILIRLHQYLVQVVQPPQRIAQTLPHLPRRLRLIILPILLNYLHTLHLHTQPQRLLILPLHPPRSPHPSLLLLVLARVIERRVIFRIFYIFFPIPVRHPTFRRDRGGGGGAVAPRARRPLRAGRQGGTPLAHEPEQDGAPLRVAVDQSFSPLPVGLVPSRALGLGLLLLSLGHWLALGVVAFVLLVAGFESGFLGLVYGRSTGLASALALLGVGEDALGFCGFAFGV